MIMRDPTGVYAIFDIGDNSFLAAGALGQVGLEWQVAGFGGFNGTDTSDMILRNSTTGAFEVYDISNNAITSAASMGDVGLEWTVSGFGDFSTNPGETDMLMQNSNTGAFEDYGISNNKIMSARSIGELTPTLGYQVAGLGDFSSNPGETDMLLRNSSTGVFAVLDISNNVFTPTPTIANTIGQVGLEWQVAGFGDFSGNANETDMLMRNSNTGQFEVYDISHNVITSAAAMGRRGRRRAEVVVGAAVVDYPRNGAAWIETEIGRVLVRRIEAHRPQHGLVVRQRIRAAESERLGRAIVARGDRRAGRVGAQHVAGILAAGDRYRGRSEG
jgi:hypothetical protein